MRERARVLERHVVDERAVVGPGVPLDDVQLLGMRCTASIEPELVVEADGVDDERIAVPPADRMSEPRRNRCRRVLSAIHIDDTMRAIVHQLVEDVDVRQAL
jgi:hypothetical protein